MPDMLDTLPNTEAAKWLREKARTNAIVLRELKPEARAHAFAVAGIEDMERLRRVQEAVAKVPEGGDWREARETIAEALGNPEKAKARAENVLRTNCFQAYSAARYRSQMADRDVFPYLKYVTMGDARVREAHARLDGTVLPKGDPFRESHYPPWDWGCRRVAVELTETMAREEAEEGEATVRDGEWSRQWREAHKAGDEAREYQHRPGSLTMALDEVALKRNANGRLVHRYSIDDLRTFNAKMEKATVERTRADGTVETVTVREWMREPVREKAEAKVPGAGRDGREHAVVVDRDTGEELGFSDGAEGSVAPDFSKAGGRDVCVYHGHPDYDLSFSPKDVLAAMRQNVGELGAVTRGGSARIRALERNERLAERVRDFDRRLHGARTVLERIRIQDEREAFLAGCGTTGVFKVEGPQ